MCEPSCGSNFMQICNYNLKRFTFKNHMLIFIRCCQQIYKSNQWPMKHSKQQETHSIVCMQEHIQFIQEFANTIANTFKQFAHLARVHLKKTNQQRPEFAEIQQQLIQQRKKRMELQDIIRQRVSGARQASQQSGQQASLSSQQRKRPKTAFLLFVADQRQKILREHPTLDLYKITSLAAIKWKKLNKQQQQVYEKKLEQMNKISDQQIRNMKSKQANNESNYVKKQFGSQNQEVQAQHHHGQGQDKPEARQDEERKAEHQPETYKQRNSGMQEYHDNQGQQSGHHEEQIQQTLAIENIFENQATQKIEQVRESEQVFQNFGELFKTQGQQNFYVSEGEGCVKQRQMQQGEQLNKIEASEASPVILPYSTYQFNNKLNKYQRYLYSYIQMSYFSVRLDFIRRRLISIDNRLSPRFYNQSIGLFTSTTFLQSFTLGIAQASQKQTFPFGIIIGAYCFSLSWG